MGHRTPRLRVSGMVWNGDSLLLIRQGRDGDTRWMLPGGGVDPGESLTVALFRELDEEIGVTKLSVGEPCALIESIAPETHVSGRHVIHVVFRVDVPEVEKIAVGRGVTKDPAIHEVRWFTRDELNNLVLHPPISGYLSNYQSGSDFEYFGSLWAP